MRYLARHKGSIMKKILSLLLILGLLLSLAIGFAEDETSTYGTILKNIGVLEGTGKGLEEDKVLLREELVAVLVRLVDSSKVEMPTEPFFSDVPKEHWAYETIEKAHVLGITDGDEGKFGLGQVVDQQQATMFLMKMLGYAPEWETVITYANEEHNIILTGDKGQFVRGNMFDLTCQAMLKNTAESKVFMDNGKFSPEQVEMFKTSAMPLIERDKEKLNAAPKEDTSEIAVSDEAKELIGAKAELIEFLAPGKEDAYIHYLDAYEYDGYKISDYYNVHFSTNGDTDIRIESTEGIGMETWTKESYEKSVDGTSFIINFTYKRYVPVGEPIETDGKIMIIKSGNSYLGTVSKHNKNLKLDVIN